jgi:hypothetical protein
MAAVCGHNASMKKLLGLLAALAIAYALYSGGAPSGPGTRAGDAPAAAEASVDDGSLRRAIDARADDVPVTGSGEVVRLLPDDRDGSPHQRILLRVAGGGTVLVAHNLALAPRVAPLALGDRLEFAGDYVWNDKGGLVHWTHPDPQGRHRAGFLRRAP